MSAAKSRAARSESRPSRRTPARTAAGQVTGDATQLESDGRRARRLRTEARLLAALDALLREAGVAALGVNAVAQRARVDKVLIYRYFGGLEGLMAEYARRSDFWPSLDDLLPADIEQLAASDPAWVAAKLLHNYARALRQRPLTLDLLAWECAHRNPLTVALESVREQRSQELYERLRHAGFPLGLDALELSALFAGAINYLALRSRDIKVFGGLQLQGDAAWQRIEAVMALAFQAAFLAPKSD